MATGAGIRLLERTFPGIETGPLYYISTHGYYNMGYYDSIDEVVTEYDINVDPLLIKVPRNTIIIEFSSPGEVCYFLNVKDTLEPLLNDRTRLLSYLSGIPPASDNAHTKKVILSAISACHIYVPGSTICNRLLTLGGGMKPLVAGGRLSSERTGIFSEMKFEKYDASGAPSTEILSKMRTFLVEGSHGGLNSRGRSTGPGPTFTSYQQILHDIPNPEDEFRIVIFPSCGVVYPSATISVDKAIGIISGVQATSKDSWSSVISGRNIHRRNTTFRGSYVLSHKNYLKGQGPREGGGGAEGGGGGGGGGGSSGAEPENENLEGGSRRRRFTRRVKKSRKSRRRHR